MYIKNALDGGGNTAKHRSATIIVTPERLHVADCGICEVDWDATAAENGPTLVADAGHIGTYGKLVKSRSQCRNCTFRSS